ncbi:uncharacterized protein LOC109788679 [Cajanus cajan]|uniref:Uncharacterized protein n=1 Tax=Cajanus cajan TaxID=3821 RepID=A0A151RAE0_CAJCA|nr:uncharacterized protein LOC109788679 [Cajanus cajan]KYP39476.1 hypothetical protein KK1_039210 [Cajanus cajan]
MGATTCSAFFTLRSPSSVESSLRHHSSSGCGKFDGVAKWFINGVTMAFFASLNRCYCIRITTEEDAEDANDLPLMLNDANLHPHAASASAAARRRTAKGSKTQAVLLE